MCRCMLARMRHHSKEIDQGKQRNKHSSVGKLDPDLLTSLKAVYNFQKQVGISGPVHASCKKGMVGMDDSMLSFSTNRRF